MRGLRTDASPEEQECAILAAATFEFSDVGVRRANMDLVAQQGLRISRSTLYRRFPSKEHLLTAVMQQACDQITAQISLRVEGLGLRETIVEAFRVALTEVEQNGLLRRIITEEVDRWKPFSASSATTWPRSQ